MQYVNTAECEQKIYIMRRQQLEKYLLVYYLKLLQETLMFNFILVTKFSQNRRTFSPKFFMVWR